jgi:uncharacterized protein CbrC (UPF0167 family)
MTGEPLPTFRHHRDPVGDGTIVQSAEACDACDRARGLLVTSTAYGEPGGLSVPRARAAAPSSSGGTRTE